MLINVSDFTFVFFNLSFDMLMSKYNCSVWHSKIIKNYFLLYGNFNSISINSATFHIKCNILEVGAILMLCLAVIV